jgi:hypothetical protein
MRQSKNSMSADRVSVRPSDIFQYQHIDPPGTSLIDYHLFLLFLFIFIAHFLLVKKTYKNPYSRSPVKTLVSIEPGCVTRKQSGIPTSPWDEDTFIRISTRYFKFII